MVKIKEVRFPGMTFSFRFTNWDGESLQEAVGCLTPFQAWCLCHGFDHTDPWHRRMFEAGQAHGRGEFELLEWPEWLCRSKGDEE